MRIPQFNRQVSDNSVPNVQVNGACQQAKRQA